MPSFSSDSRESKARGQRLYSEYKKTLPTQWEEYLESSLSKHVSSLKTSPVGKSRPSTQKKRKMGAATTRSPPHKGVVTLQPLQEEPWDKDQVKIELSYPIQH